MEYKQWEKGLEQKLVGPLKREVEELKQQVQHLQKELGRGRGSVDHLLQQAADIRWEARCTYDSAERQRLYPVRLLRSRDPGALPCEPTPAGVEAFLQCQVGSVLHVERMRDNARGKQRYFVQFNTAKAATAAYAGFRDSSNATQAVLDLRRTSLQNSLVNLAIKLQHIGRMHCGFGEGLVVRARGTRILVKRGEGELVPYPFLQHLPTGRLPKPCEPYQHLTAGLLGQQLKLLLCKPSPPVPQAPTSLDRHALLSFIQTKFLS